jgi:hypothetical protein
MDIMPELPPFFSLRVAAVDGVEVWLVEMNECYSFSLHGFSLPPCDSREEAIDVAWSTFRDYGDRKWYEWITAKSRYDLTGMSEAELDNLSVAIDAQRARGIGR